MYGKMQEHLQNELNGIREAGLFKRERIITTPQAAVIQTKSDAERMLNQRVVAIMREAEQKIRAAEDEVKTWVDT